MKISKNIELFNSLTREINDSTIPIEKHATLEIERYIYFLRNGSAQGDQEKLDRDAFLIESLHNKLPDAHLDILLKLSKPLSPILDEWLENKRIPYHLIGVRLWVNDKLVIQPQLCNHSGGACDCADGHKPT